MKTKVAMPHKAVFELHRHYNAWSGPGIVAEFSQKFGYTDEFYHNKAHAENTSITEAVRRTIVLKHPDIAQHWPERVPTAAQLAGYRKIAQQARPGVPGVLAAGRVINTLLQKPYSGQARRRAREWLKRNGIEIETSND